MRKLLISIIVLGLTFPVFSQKISVQVTKSKKAAGTEWQILDKDFFQIVTGSDFQNSDSVSFGLDINTRYYLELSLTDTFNSDSLLCRLYINSEPVLLVRSGLPAGDHFYTFVTGVRESQTKITGGTNADISDYPWQIFLEAATYTCGGSIISGNWVVTAAHCTEYESGGLIPASLMNIVAGANNPRSGLEGQTYSVSKVIRHPGYNSSTLENDIALLQISTAINYTNATPIRLVSTIDSAGGAIDPGVMSWVTGYGLTNVPAHTIPTHLQQVQLPIISVAQASTVWPDIASTDLMAGYKNGNKDACSGDSGGPLVVKVDNEFKLAGLVSWGSSNCNTYGAYTRTSTFEKWITANTGIEISYSPPVPSGDSIVCTGITSSKYSVVAIAGVTAYEWQILPALAGSIQGSSGQATVTWTKDYIGSATIRLRVTKNGIVSYWSALTVHTALYTNLLAKTGDTTICASQPVVLKVRSQGYNLAYSWFKNDTLVQRGSSDEYLISTTTVNSTGLYRCDINGSCGEPLSPETGLTVLPVTVIKNISPDKEVKSGDDVVIKVVADGHLLNYLWQKDSVQIPDGTDPEYSMLNVTAANTGLYKVDITGTCGEVLSKGVYIYVTANENHADPEIFVWPTVAATEFYVALSSDLDYNLLLFSSAGRLIKDIRSCRYRTTISMSDVSEGLYIVTVYGNNFRKSVKVIKN